MKIDAKILGSDKQDSTDSDKADEPVFKKMTPKRHSRTESISITKVSDLQDLDIPAPKPELQIVVTEAEEQEKSENDLSDKISSESSREIEISDRKSSEGISDRISSEDAVTEKKTSSEEEVAPVVYKHVKDEIAASVLVIKETTTQVQPSQDGTILKDRKLLATTFLT